MDIMSPPPYIPLPINKALFDKNFLDENLAAFLREQIQSEARFPTITELQQAIKSLGVPVSDAYETKWDWEISFGGEDPDLEGVIWGSVLDDGTIEFNFRYYGSYEDTVLGVMEAVSEVCGAYLIVEGYSGEYSFVPHELQTAYERWKANHEES